MYISDNVDKLVERVDRLEEAKGPATTEPIRGTVECRCM